MNTPIALNLRSKILLAILLAWGFLLFFGYGTSLTLKENYLNLEKKIAVDEMHRAKDALRNLNNALAIQAANWAVWDDLYQYTLNKNTYFYNKNLIAAAIFPLTSVDYIVGFNKVGNVFFSIGINPKRNSTQPVPKSLLAEFAKNTTLGQMFYKPNIMRKVQGIIYTSEGMIFLASHSISKSDGTSPSQGTWLLGQRLSTRILQNVRKTTQLNLHLYPVASLHKNTELNQFYKKMLISKQIFIKSHLNKLSIYDLIEDINKKAVILIEIHLPRNVHNAGMKTIKYFNSVLFISGLVFALLLYFVLSKLIIYRLQNINERVIDIQQTRDFNTIIPVEGNDELASVSIEANKMLGFIRDYDAENKKIISAIANELEENTNLTDKLQETKSFLYDLINSMPSLLVIINKNLEIVLINNEAERVLQEALHNIIGQNLYKYFPYLAKIKKNLKKAIDTNKNFSTDKLIDMRNNEPHYFNVIIFPLKQADLISIRIDDVSHWVKLQETMIQSEKMASIGVLTAGVAHEINNPINFVLTAVSPLQNDLQDIREIITKYKENSQGKNTTNADKDFQSLLQAIDLPYIIQEIEELITGIQDGITRTATIVNDLQSVSGAKNNKIEKINIHECIDSSLTLLIHRYKQRIDIIKEYENIPLIDGYPGRLNQVFMNVLANACDAILDKGEVRIRTYVKDEDLVEIAIKDNGIGIPAEMFMKIFDPFYTTKEVGKGTGLGLSITRTIIEELKGQIQVLSDVGKGSEFIITLPINKSNRF